LRGFNPLPVFDEIHQRQVGFGIWISKLQKSTSRSLNFMKYLLCDARLGPVLRNRSILLLPTVYKIAETLQQQFNGWISTHRLKQRKGQMGDCLVTSLRTLLPENSKGPIPRPKRTSFAFNLVMISLLFEAREAAAAAGGADARVCGDSLLIMTKVVSQRVVSTAVALAAAIINSKASRSKLIGVL